jgi:hypothetical protein
MLRRYTWEKAKEKLLHYRRRSPETSPLYQIVYHSRDDLSVQWEHRFQHQYGCLRDEVLKTLDEYLNCGILAHGAARVYCDGCKRSLLIAFSCKRRGGCPSCGAKRAVKFAEHIYGEVIEDLPHRHTVFTIPKRLRVFFKYDRKLNTILFRAAWGALSQVLGVNEREVAAIFTVQTAGEALNYHPHLHGLLADGYRKEGVFTRLSEVTLKAIEEAFAERVLAHLHKRELISEDHVEGSPTLLEGSPSLLDRSASIPQEFVVFVGSHQNADKIQRLHHCGSQASASTSTVNRRCEIPFHPSHDIPLGTLP